MERADVAQEAVERLPSTRTRTDRTGSADEAARLFRAWRAGLPDAAGDLVRLLTPTLWHVARAYRLDAASAEDCVQTTWLALARHRDDVRDPQAVLGWLLVTVRREAARAARTARREDVDPDLVLDLTSDPAPGPATQVVTADDDRQLWRAVSALPERCQRLLRVIAFSDRPDYAALSDDLGMPVGSIGPTRGRCLAKLRKALGEGVAWTRG